MKIKKRSLFARIATFIVILGGSGFGAYLLVPSKKVAVDQHISMDDEGGIDPNSYFGRLVTRVSKLIDEEEPEVITGLKGEFEDLEVTWPSKSKTSMNDIKVDGMFALAMDGLDNLNFTVDLEADYNSKKLDLALGLVDKNLYLAVKDLKIKSSNSNTEELLSTMYGMFFDPENENGLGINLDLDQILDSILGGIDLGGLSLDGLDVTETVIDEDVKVDISIAGIGISILMEEETLNLKMIDVGTIKIDDVTIKGKIKFDMSESVKVRGLDDPLYEGKKRTNFVEMIGYVGWADRILNLLDSRKLGLNLNASLSKDNENGMGATRIVGINSSINLDMSDLFDLSKININELLGLSTEEVEETTEAEQTEEAEEQSFGDKLLDGIKLDAYFNVVGQKDEDYANLALAYFERAGYLTLNEFEGSAVMQAKIDVATVGEIIDRIPNMIEAVASVDTSNAEKTEETTEGLFDFVTSSELVTAIKDGVYDGILDVLKTIKNTEDKIEIELDLSSLGFGEQSIIKLILDASNEAITNGSKVLNLSIENVEINDLNLDLELSTKQYSSVILDKTVANKDKFDDMHFVTGVFDQVVSILNVKKGYADLKGKILDDYGLGFTFDGWMQYDYPVKYGYGSIKFDEYKNSSVEPCASHTVDIDVNNYGTVNSNKNMYFEYREKLKGKFTVQTLNDIIDLVKKLINEQNPRFTKFLDPIKELLFVGVLGDVLNNKDYVALAKPNFIKKIAQSDNGSKLNVVINKDILNLQNDITLTAAFKKDASGNEMIDYIEISGIKLGEKNIYLKVSLLDYKEELTTPVDKSNLSKFYDFSDISILLAFGINTTELNVYHLTMDPASVAIGSLDLIKIKLDFYIVVDGVSTYVYGRIPKVPFLTSAVTINDFLGATKVCSEFVFEPSHDASGNDIGGYFHILKNYDHSVIKDESYYYRCESSKFLENIMGYLITDLLNIRSFIYENVSLDLAGADDSNYEDLFLENGFKYTKSDGKHNWHIGLDMEALTSSSSLGDLTVDLQGTEVNGVGYFSRAVVKMKLLGGFININGELILDNPNPNITAWPVEVEQSYQKIIGIYNNMSAADRAKFDKPVSEGGYLNNPFQDWKISYQKPITLPEHL